MSILGALLATIASQSDQPQLRLNVAISGAVALAAMSFLSARLLTGIHVNNWITARAASEALKRAVYKYAASAAPYNDPATCGTLLNEERNRIELDVDDLAGLQVATTEPGSSPRTDLTREQYIKERVRQQIERYYAAKAEAYRKAARTLRLVELILSLFATVITAVVGVAGKEVIGFKFDIVAITAVLTTVAGAILAHIEAGHYDFMVTAYRTTTRRLANELANVKDVSVLSPEDWSAFVDRCEMIISEENANRIAKWSKPPASLASVKQAGG